MNPPKYEIIDDSRSSRVPITLSWNSINCQITTKSGPICKRTEVTKPILTDVSGLVKPGQLLAILGPSGAGKSSLLDILSGRKNTGTITGSVKINGMPPTRDFKRQTGYVTQDDALIGNLTVRETFRFHAALKMPPGTTPEQREQRIDEIIDELALRKAADQFIGTQFRRGISGGEKKRVSIGCELLTDPGLLFLDEPTTGLDAYNSLSVMKTLRRLAQAGRTIVCTIHQPRTSIYELFDHIMILSLGRTVYHGPAAGVVAYFSSLGYQCPDYSNPADYLIDTVVLNERAQLHALRQGAQGGDDNDNDATLPQDYFLDEDLPEASPQGAPVPLHVQFSASQQCLALLEQIGQAESKADFAQVPPRRTKFSSPWLVQLYWLGWRTVLNYFRNPLVTYIQLAQTLLFSVLVGLIYLQIDDTVTALQDRLGSIFFIMTQQAFATMGSSINNFLIEREIYQREQQSGLYYTSAYFFAKSSIEGPTLLVFPTIYSCIAYWMIGLSPEAETFLVFLGAILTFAAVAASFFLLVGALSPSPVVAQILAPLIVVLMFLFGGFYVNNDNVPVYFEWLKYWSFFYWCYSILLYNELNDFNNGIGFLGTCNCSFSETCNCCNDANANFTHNGTKCQYYVTGDDELRILGLSNVNIVEYFGVLLGMLVAYRFLCYLALRFLYKEKK